MLLVMPDYGKKIFYNINIGLMYVSSYLKQKGHSILCINMNHHKSQELIELLEGNCFDVIGTGGHFIHLPAIKSLINIIRQYNPSAKIVLGGGIASTDFEFIFHELKPDFLVVGEGEITLDLLLQALKNNTDLHKVTGIVFKENGNIIKTSPTPLIGDLDTLPFPDYESFEYRYYLDNFSPDADGLHNILDISKRRVGFVVSSRDCVQNCTFCFRVMGGNETNKNFRVRSVGNFIKEIKFLIDKYNINGLNLLDDMFAANKNRVFEFCEMIKPLKLRWQCQMRVNIADVDLLMVMKDAGCYLIGYGFESGSPVVLKSMRKGIRPEQIKRALEASIKAKITIQGNFIFGDPAETIETMKETIGFAREYKSLFLGFGMVKPYPGSFIYNRLVENKKLIDKLSFYHNPLTLINMTTLSSCDFKYLCRKVASESTSRYRSAFGKILKLKNEKESLYKLSIRCQHCRIENNATININFTSSKRNINFLVCRDCFQRILINVHSLRFGNIAESLRYICYSYALEFITLNPGIHSFVNFLASKMKINRILRMFGSPAEAAALRD